jgi:hypothetical protein
MRHVLTAIHTKSGVLLALVFTLAGIAPAQSLNWEGQTGVFVTPLAYTAASPANNVGKPIVAYHFLDVGPVLGDFHTASVTEGLFGRVELGYTRVFHGEGSTPALSPLWTVGFNIAHGKGNLIKENAGKQKWLPAISAGFVERIGIQNVSGVLFDNNSSGVTNSKSYNSGDYYVVGTKSVTQPKKLPLVLNLGYKATNASVYGLAGVAPSYTGRLFGAAAFVVKGPAKSTLIFGSEFAQQPRSIQNLPGADIPTTLTYAARIVPFEKTKLNVDFGITQAAGEILPGVDLKVRHQFAFGISYGI